MRKYCNGKSRCPNEAQYPFKIIFATSAAIRINRFESSISENLNYASVHGKVYLMRVAQLTHNKCVLG